MGLTYLHVDVGNVPDHVLVVVEDGDRGDAFPVHELEGFGQRAVAADHPRGQRLARMIQQ